MLRKIHFLKISLSLFVALILSTSAWGLSPKLEAKKNWLMTEKALEKEDYSMAISYLEKMKGLGVELQPEYYFQYGRSLVKSGKFKEGLVLLNNYIEKAGEEAEYVEWALELMGEAENPKMSGKCLDNMSFIPSGVFLAGSVNSLKEMSINALCIDQFEVVQKQYQAVMGKNPSEFKGDDLPVHSVTWHEAKAYCEKVGKRLPTEWEWEKAAKAGTSTKYYWGDDPSSTYAWYGRDYFKGPYSVGQKEPNAFGLYDMSGNAGEWTDSDHESDIKVSRGGSWSAHSANIVSSDRYELDPLAAYANSGFRCSQ